MKKPLLYVLLACSASLLGIAMYACGDDGASSFTISPDSGSTISISEKITITFNGGINKDSVLLSGNMADLAKDGVWSGNVLTLSPKDTWNGGEAGALTVKAGTLTEQTANYGFKVGFTKFQKAGVVIGQPDFASTSINQGGAAAANTLYGPFGMPAISDDGKLIFTDTENSRTLIFNSIPTTNNKSANLVIGQPDFVTTTQGQAANEMARPEGVLINDGKLFVKDYSNDRILVFNSIPTTNHASANLVIGQATFGPSVGTCDNKTLSSPEGFWIIGGKLLVADSNHNRILIWNSIPTTSGKAADLVLGQSNFNHCEYNDANQDDVNDASPSSKTLNYPSGVWSDGTKLIVSDSGNNRVLIWNTFPTANFQAADIVLGQATFAHSTNNDDNQDGSSDTSTSARTLDYPYYLYSNGTQLFLDDDDNARILVWNTIPTTSFAKADLVLGQNDFIHNQKNDDNQDGVSDAGATARTIGCAEGLTLYRDKLIVADDCNNRVLIYQGE